MKGLLFDISYTKFHDLNSIHPVSVTDFMKHVVGWKIRKNVEFVASWPSLLGSPKGNGRDHSSSYVSKSLRIW